jgi:hypothetical protein
MSLFFNASRDDDMCRKRKCTFGVERNDEKLSCVFDLFSRKFAMLKNGKNMCTERK